jgi:esterase/lipase superfamily enzyme
MRTRPWIAMLALCLAVQAGCSPRGAITLKPEAAEVGAVHRILVGTTRAAGAPGGATVFSNTRSETLSFALFDVSVPPEREPGTVSFPTNLPPDPAADYVTVAARRLGSEAAFIAAVNAEVSGRAARDREAVVFVHGFNTNFPEGLYRHAQMRHDFRTPGVAISYAWPSAASVRAYGLDRESALFARDGLERLLDVLARTDVSRILVIGHSMGALVVMDTVRQMAIRGSPRFFDKLGAVILMAPDLDVGVVRTQLQPLADKDVPLYIFVSTRDRALRLSSFIRGGPARLGSIRDLSGVAGLNIVVIDISDVGATSDPLGHFKVATSPSMIALIGGMDNVGIEMFQDEERRPNVFETTINMVQGVTEVVLQPLAQ